MSTPAAPRPPSAPLTLVVCAIDGVRYAVRAADVVEVVRAAALVPLPGAPDVILGLLDLRGVPVPVLDARRRFGHPPRALDPAERFVVADAGARRVALRVDHALALVEVDASAVEDPRRHVAGVAQVAGVVALADGLLLIHDVVGFLSAAEAEALDRAAASAGAGAAPAAAGAR